MCAVQTRKTKRTTSSVVLFFFVLKHANPCKFRMDNLQITPLIDSTSLGCCWSFSACSYRSLTVGSPIPRRTVKILPNDPSTAWRRPATKVRCGGRPQWCCGSSLKCPTDEHPSFGIRTFGKSQSQRRTCHCLLNSWTWKLLLDLMGIRSDWFLRVSGSRLSENKVIIDLSCEPKRAQRLNDINLYTCRLWNLSKSFVGSPLSGALARVRFCQHRCVSFVKSLFSMVLCRNNLVQRSLRDLW